jgi:single-strand DNA-binding protein
MSKTNKVILIGNFGDEIKMHHFEGGNCVGRVPMATTETYKNKEGEKVSNTEWHNLVFRNKGAEIIEKYTSKGDKLYIEGRLKYRVWEGEDGQKNYSTEIHVNDFEFLSTKKQEVKDPARALNEAVQTPTPPKEGEDGFVRTKGDGDDDLPF